MAKRGNRYASADHPYRQGYPGVDKSKARKPKRGMEITLKLSETGRPKVYTEEQRREGEVKRRIEEIRESMQIEKEVWE